ncbi:VQ motif-containing protein 8, chloroplastic-like [Carica papaya]|uniref:VQ motif-containing protein 8, chloroplastic-like n=1 Tax=Carica papaya TaxID=3649 RepID=UPI000B8C72F1|nr:VQ motif-containing protein 8, chloroplastic-like [Carica papaya]
MNSAKSNDEHGNHGQESAKKEMMINGSSRPSPLKIHKESRLIQKQQHRQPVIIYAHSPKVIHTQARDFMALVQRLTGLDKTTSDENDSSSVLTDENSAATNINSAAAATAATVMSSSSSSSPSQVMNTTNNNNQHNHIPIFTPNSSDLFCSPRPVFRFSETSTIANSLSPSFLEFMKGLPDY